MAARVQGLADAVQGQEQAAQERRAQAQAARERGEDIPLSALAAVSGPMRLARYEASRSSDTQGLCPAVKSGSCS